MDCPADVNYSCAVDIDDIFDTLSKWGRCDNTGPSEPPQSIIDFILQYAGDPEELETCIEAMILIGSGE